MEEESHDLGLVTRHRERRFTAVTYGHCMRESLAPRPTLALVKFWQGRMAFALRILCIAFSGGTLAAALAIQMALHFPHTNEDLIEQSRSTSHDVTTWAISIASIAITTQLLTVLGRFLNFSCVTSRPSLFQVLDIISNVVYTAAYFTVSIPMAVFTGDLAHYDQLLPDLAAIVHYDQLRVRYYIAMGLCLVTVVCHFLLALWMAIYLSFNWERKFSHASSAPSRTPSPV